MIKPVVYLWVQFLSPENATLESFTTTHSNPEIHTSDDKTV
jgi:hypothetical protein